MAGVINMIAAPPVPEGTVKGTTHYIKLTTAHCHSFLSGGQNNKGLIWDLRYTNKQAHAYQNNTMLCYELGLC